MHLKKFMNCILKMCTGICCHCAVIPVRQKRSRRETFLQAMKSMPSFRGECKMTVWLCQIAKHLYFASRKKQKRRQDAAALLGNIQEGAAAQYHTAKMPQGLSASDTLEQLLCDEEDAMRIHTLLHQMEEPYKEVFMLRVFGELPFKKIARIFGKTENWARVTYHRAKLKIMDEMEKSNGKDIL